MRVVVCPADDGGCGWYRLRFAARHLQQQGHDIVLSEDGSKERADAFDVVVFQRPLRRRIAEWIPILQQHGVAVVVEVDDDFQTIPPANPAFRACHPKLSPGRNWHHLAEACRHADLVTVSTPALARRYGRHGRVVVLPNVVPEAYLAIRPADMPGNMPVLGWTGTPMTHPGDLEQTRGTVPQVLADTGARFRAIGSQRTLTVLGVEGDVVEWAPLTDLGPGGYPAAIASLDVGIVPLADHQFNAAKSNIKGLEYAALGVPFVASPTPEYERLVRLGGGRLATRRRDWVRHLGALLGDERVRQEEAERGRDVAAGLTVEGHAWRWWEAWEAALSYRRGSMVA